MPQKIILDTDIGDDIDDAYALALILGSPELELLGVTTVFGNTPARARQAQTILRLAERDDVPVASGCGGVMSPRVSYPFSSAQRYLENAQTRQFETCLPNKDLPALSPLHGVDFLIETILDGGGDIVPVTIGAMTNMATAMVKEPRIVERIPRIVAMAGAFTLNRSEWNIKCDPVAAAIVLDSEVPMTLIGLDVTLQCRFNDADLKRLHETDRPVARNLSAATRAWAGNTGRKMPVLHDPLAVETLFRPGLVDMRNGRAAVELAGERTYEYTVFAPAAKGKKGPHDVGSEVRAREAIDLWLDRALAV